MAESDHLGKLESVQLVMTPLWSHDGCWRFIPIKRIDMQLHPADGADAEAIVQAVDGTRYGGFPIQALAGDVGELLPLAELSVL